MADTLPDDQITDRLRDAGLDGWSYDDGAIRRSFSLDTWPQTQMAAAAVAWVCEIANHHPALSLGYGELKVSLVDHGAGGVTMKDVLTARRIEDTLLWRPDADGPLEGGTPDTVVEPA